MSWESDLNDVFRTSLPIWNGPRVANDGEGVFIAPNTERWFRARRGRVTASSRAEKIGIAPDLNSLAPLAREIRAELEHDYVIERKGNAYTQWGHDHEKEALYNLAMDLGQDFTEPGLIFHREFAGAACTPDAFFGADITAQVKCPYYSRNHLKMLYSKTISRTYWYQVQFESWLSQRRRILFASYDPRQPLATKLFKLWVEPHEETWAQFEAAMGWLRRIIDGETTPVRLTSVSGMPILF